MILAVFPLEMSVSRQCFDGMAQCIAAIASLQSAVMVITTSIVLALTTKAFECFSGCFLCHSITVEQDAGTKPAGVQLRSK